MTWYYGLTLAVVQAVKRITPPTRERTYGGAV